MTIKSNTNKYFFKYSIVKPEQGIEIRYSHISDLMDFVLSEKKYSSGFNKAEPGMFFKENDFIPEFFSHEELQAVNNFKALKKQIEWMAGRCLIKQMVLEYSGHLTPLSHSGLHFNDIIISHHDEGAPFLKNWPFLKISISHSGKYAAAALCIIKEKDIGLDIEKIGKMPDSSFMKIAFTAKEIADIRHYPGNTLKRSEKLFKKWTIKEAFLKYIKKGFNESLRRVEVLDDQIFHNGEKKADVSIFSTIIGNKTGDNYYLSMVS